MKISKNMVASFDYVLTDDKGETLDSSTDHGPLVYLHGSGNIIPGLESQLEGRSTGDSFKAVVKPQDGYGEFDAALIQVVKKDQFAGIKDLSVGMQFKVSGHGGTPMVVAISKIAGDDVTVDGNHPLAGKTLHFAVTVKNVRAASAVEISHGHVHGEGGHNH